MLQIARNYVAIFAQYLCKDEKGATAIEYGLIAALVSDVMIVTLIAVGISLRDVFGNIDTELQNGLNGS
jgi:pilus assembly protein Flp/PilA